MRKNLLVLILMVSIEAIGAQLSIPLTASIEGWSLFQTLDLNESTHHVQGIDYEAKTAWVTTVELENRKGFLIEFSLDSGRKLRSIEIQDGKRFHPGGISANAESLWIPIAEYRPHSTSIIQKRSKRTLQVEFQFQVPDHIGCLAVTPDQIIGGNWDSREFYIWDHKGNLLQKISSDTQNAYQDMKYDPPFVVASGLLADHTGAIDWLDLPSLKLSRRVPVGNTDRQLPLTREGMAIHRDQLLLLPEDEPSRVFIFHRQINGLTQTEDLKERKQASQPRSNAY